MPASFPSLLAAARALRAALAGFEPGLCAGEDCAVVVEELAATEKACAAARVRAAARASDCGAHREKGFADAADWLARASGTSTVAAKAELETARALEEMPETRAAAAAGELSLAQAQEVAKTEAECPGSEAELLAVAKAGSLKTLKDKARKRRLGDIDPEELHVRQHQARFFRHWRTDLGMVGFAGELPPEVGLPFVNRLDAETDRLRRRARRDGNREAREAHGADALVRLAAGGGAGKARSTDLTIVCDLRAYRRGHPHPGEPCHLVGGGPIPVSLVRQLSEDAFLKAVLHDGTRIGTVVHYGRHIKAELRTALELGTVPDFDGVTCIEVGCDRYYHLEWDHIDPRAHHGPISSDNLQPLCYPHHREKTTRDRRAGLLHSNSPGPDPP
ncbi:MAG: DUF222 domain-containing protein [Acidimicrobiia bacterium]